MTTVRVVLNALMPECLEDAKRIVLDTLGADATPEAVAMVACALFRARHLDEFGAARLSQWLREEAVNEERLRMLGDPPPEVQQAAINVLQRVQVNEARARDAVGDAAKGWEEEEQ
jgi:hypothetical protein